MHHRHHHCKPCGPKPVVLPTVMHPPKCDVKYSMQEYIIPEVHPTHTTHVNQSVYKHVHSFPHTNEQVNQAFNEHHNCGPGPMGGQPLRPPRPPRPW